jgi:hypothetical protein
MVSFDVLIKTPAGMHLHVLTATLQLSVQPHKTVTAASVVWLSDTNVMK